MQGHLYTHFIKRAAPFWLVSCFFVVKHKQALPDCKPLVIQLKYCPLLPSLNKVDYYYHYHYHYHFLLLLSTDELFAGAITLRLCSQSKQHDPSHNYVSPTLNDQIIPLRRSF